MKKKWNKLKPNDKATVTLIVICSTIFGVIFSSRPGNALFADTLFQKIIVVAMSIFCGLGMFAFIYGLFYGLLKNSFSKEYMKEGSFELPYFYKELKQQWNNGHYGYYPDDNTLKEYIYIDNRNVYVRNDAPIELKRAIRNHLLKQNDVTKRFENVDLTKYRYSTDAEK